MNKLIIIFIILFSFISSCKKDDSNQKNNSINFGAGKLKIVTNLSFENPDFRIAFDGNRTVLESNKKVFEVNSEKGTKNEIAVKTLCKNVRSFFITGMTKAGFTYTCDKSLIKYENGKSTLIKEFKEQIKWTETQGYYSAILLQNKHLEIFYEDRLITDKDFAGSENLFLSSTSESFEVISTDSKNSKLYNFQINNEKVSECSFKNYTEKLYRQTYLPETNIMVGVAIIEGQKDFKILGINCKNQNIVWSKSTLNEIFKVDKGISHLYEPGLTNSISSCKKDVCINLTNTEVAMGGKSQSGIFCFDSISGKEIWKNSSPKFDSYTGNDVAANIRGPSLCHDSNLLYFRNSNSILYYQNFPIKNEDAITLINEPDLKSLKSKLSREYKFFAHDEFLPKIFNGKIAFISSYKKLIVLE